MDRGCLDRVLKRSKAENDARHCLAMRSRSFRPDSLTGGQHNRLALETHELYDNVQSL